MSHAERNRAGISRAPNRLVSTSVDGILTRPLGRRSLIVLASDHGPGSRLKWGSARETDLEERFGSLLAIYAPAGLGLPLPDDCSPVNTFRLIFNRLFGTGYELLPNRAYYSSWT